MIHTRSTIYTGISVVEAALLRLTRDFIVPNGECENFRPRFGFRARKNNTPWAMRKEHAIRLLSSMDEKGRKRTQNGIANIAWGGGKNAFPLFSFPFVCWNGSSRNVEKYGEKDSLKDFSV